MYRRYYSWFMVHSLGWLVQIYTVIVWVRSRSPCIRVRIFAVDSQVHEYRSVAKQYIYTRGVYGINGPTIAIYFGIRPRRYARECRAFLASGSHPSLFITYTLNHE